MHQPYWSYQKPVSGADPFSPHQFEPKQVAIGQESVPKIFIMPQAYADMLTISQLSGSDEIGWLGSIRILSEYRFLIEQIFMIKQTVHGSTTEMTEEGLSDLFTDLAVEDPELCANILFWGHVHPSNSTSPSSQDDDQMALFNHNDWFIRGIFGRSGRAEFSLFDYKRGVIWKDIPWQIFVAVTEERKAFWKTEIEEKVSSVITPPTSKWVQSYNIGGGAEGVGVVHWRDRLAHGVRGKGGNGHVVKSIGLEGDDEEDDSHGFNPHGFNGGDVILPPLQDSQHYIGGYDD